MFFKKAENISQLSDDELIDRFRHSHDNKYLGELYIRYMHLVLGLCIKYFKNKEKAQDATVVIFELLMVELKKHEIKFFKSWLYTVSKNHCLQTLRKKQSQLKKEDNYQIFVQKNMESDEDLHLNDKIEKEKLLNNLEKVLPELKEKQRICVTLFYLKDKSYNEIAEETGFSVKEVKSNIQNGKRNLMIKMNSINE